MKNSKPILTNKKQYAFINPYNEPIANDYFGIHSHRWPTNRSGYGKFATTTYSPAVLNYDWTRTTDSPFGYWNSIHFKLSSLVRVGTTVTATLFDIQAKTSVSHTSRGDTYIAVGDTIVIKGANESGFNGEFTITGRTVVGSNYTYQYTSTVSGNVTATTSTYLRMFNWDRSDKYYNAYSIENKKILYTFLGIPPWASNRPYSGSPYGDTMVMGGLSDYSYLTEFCIELATRYPLITHYEAWNEPGWAYYINATALDSYRISIELFNSSTSDFAKYVVNGCTVDCSGVSKLAKIVSIDKSNIYKFILTFDIPHVGTVSGDCYVSSYYTRSVVNYQLINTTTANVTVSDASGIFLTYNTNSGPDGSISGNNISDRAYITGINGNVLTVSTSNYGTISGNVTINFAPNYYGDFPSTLAEMTRVTSASLKSVNPNIKILLAPTPSISNLKRIYAHITNNGKHPWEQAPVHWLASANGYSYLGDSGANKRMIDVVDIIAQHTYGNNEFEGFLSLKQFAAEAGYPNIEIWSTEFGNYDLPCIGDLFQSDWGITFQPTVIVSNTSSNTITIVGNSGASTVVPGDWIYDLGYNKIGRCASISDRTIYLHENAYKNYKGKGFKRTSEEKQERVIRNIVSAAAAGFKKAFFYDADGQSMGILDDLQSSRIIANTVNSIKGKTVVCVEQPKIDGPIKINFTDGSILNTADVLSPYPLISHITTQVNSTINGFTPNSTNQLIFSSGTQRNSNNIIRQIDITSIATNYNCVAISPFHIISANHSHPAIGSTLTFVDRVIGDYINNITYTKTIVSGNTIPGTDIWIGILNSELSMAITPMAVLPNTINNYIKSSDYTTGLPVYSSNSSGYITISKLNANNISTNVNGTIYNFNGNITTPNVANQIPWYSYDTSLKNPVFTVINNVSTLLFLNHYGTSPNNGGPMLHNYINEINSTMIYLTNTYASGNIKHQLIQMNLSNFT